MTETILDVADLTVKFDKHTILSNLGFAIERDSTVAVVGPNGSGKSVLFKALLKLIPYAGNINWHAEARIGYVPQKLAVQKDLPLTVMEFLELKEPNHEKIKDVLVSVGFKLEGAKHIHHDMRVLNTGLGSLSGGEMQRILMAYALLGDPNVLLLDEPTAGVDISGEKTFYSLFANLKKDKDLTILFISHDKAVVEKYADKVIRLGWEFDSETGHSRKGEHHHHHKGQHEH